MKSRPETKLHGQGASGPSWCITLLRAVLGADLAREICADLDDLYRARVERDGKKAADAWYRRQAVGCAWRLAFDRIAGHEMSPDVAYNNSLVSQQNDPQFNTRSRRGIGEAVRDIRIATRALVRRPTYSAAVVLTLALGLCGLCTVYTVANWVLLRPVPGIYHPAELGIVHQEEKQSTRPGTFSLPFSQPDAVEMAERAKHLADFTASSSQDLHFSIGSAQSAERISGAVVWPNYFEVLGTRLQAGRAFGADSASRVAVVSDRLAHRFWSRARDAMGSDIIVNGSHFTVIGVAPREFHGTNMPGQTDVWLPASAIPEVTHSKERLRRGQAQVWEELIVRRHGAVHGADIAADMNRTVDLIRKERPADNSFFSNAFEFRGYDGVGLNVGMRDGVARTLRIVGFAALVLLLLTCANIANLGLTRAANTTMDSALRRALGAGMGSIMRERIIESGIIAIAGAAGGLLLTAAVLKTMNTLSLMQGGITLEGIHINSTVVVFSGCVAIAAGLAAGIVPALVSARTDAGSLLRSARHGFASSTRIRAALVIAQVSMSLVLVIWCTLLSHTLWNLRHVDFGFSQNGVITFALDPAMQGYDDARTLAFMRDLIGDLRANPSIKNATVSDHAVFGSFSFQAGILPDGANEKGGKYLYFRRWQTTPEFFSVFDIPLLAGTTFTTDWTERDSVANPVGLLNEAALQRVLPGVSPAAAIGRTVRLANYPRPVLVTITGVVRNTRMSNVDRPDEPYFYQPWSQGWESGQFNVHVRATGSTKEAMATIRRVTRRLDSTLPVYGMRTMQDEVDEQLTEQRFVAKLALAVAATGVILAMLGLYAMLSYVVIDRTREIGVRAALGAMPRELLGDVITGGLLLSSIGVVLGLSVALTFSNLISSRLYGVHAFDGMTYSAASIGVFVMATLASAIPGWRATRVDPITALRAE